jgi:hypothetical protein
MPRFRQHNQDSLELLRRLCPPLSIAFALLVKLVLWSNRFGISFALPYSMLPPPLEPIRSHIRYAVKARFRFGWMRRGPLSRLHSSCEFQPLNAKPVLEEHMRILVIYASQPLCCGLKISRLVLFPTYQSPLDWPETLRQEPHAVLEVQILGTASAR